MSNAKLSFCPVLTSALNQCCLCQLRKRFARSSGSQEHENAKANSNTSKDSKESLCSKIVDGICFQPEVGETSRTLVVSPETFELPFESVEIQTVDGVTLMGFLILQDEVNYTKIPTIIFYHGNSGNIGDNLQRTRGFYRSTNFNVLLVEYRGYGFSEGRPSENGVYLDSQAAFDYVWRRPDLDSTQIVVFGTSLGGAIAIDLATRENYKNRIAVVVVENTFFNLMELGRHLAPKRVTPFLKLLPLSKKFASYNKISSVVRPTLFISSQNDRVIPPTQMTKLHMECTAEKKILRLDEGNHINAWVSRDYMEVYSEFVLHAIKNNPLLNY